MDEFFLPGYLASDAPLADEARLHIAGYDDPAAIAFDALDIFGNDPNIGEDGPAQWKRETLPQFGPQFVGYVHDQFGKQRELIEKLLERWSYEPRTDYFIASMQTTGAGGIDTSTVANASLYEPPPGFSFALHRFVIFDAAHTLGSPYTNAASWWEGRMDGEMIFGNSMISGQGQLPAFMTWGTRDAPRIRDGGVLSLFMSGGPANTKIVVKGQGTLDRVSEG